MFKTRTTDQELIEGHLISPVYMDEVFRSVILLFCAKTSDSDNARTHLTRISKKNVVRID